jgi:CheY-like chemotaxis protein
MGMASDAVRDLVEDALSNLYDPVHLRTHGLLHELAIASLPGESSGEALRRALREAIEALRPPDTVPNTRHEWLQYRTLTHHYVRCLTPDETCQELSISRSSFYRRRREGLDDLVCVLRTRYSPIPLTPDQPSMHQTDGRDDPERALDLLATLPHEAFDVAELTHSAERTVRPLAEQRRVTLLTRTAPGMQPGYGIATVIRQVLLGALAECLSNLEDDKLEVCLANHGNEAWWRLQATQQPERLRAVAYASAESFWRRLLAACEGRIWIDDTPSGDPALHLALPVFRAQPTILAIDDDARASELYARYLEAAGYHVTSARNAAEAQEHLDRGMPDLVLLDVILPQEDGWAILARLRANAGEGVPASYADHRIPVVVCSVIEQPELALALGANAVLNKPISPNELLAAVQELLLLVDRRETASAAPPANA